jgi:hypothetical protein
MLRMWIRTLAVISSLVLPVAVMIPVFSVNVIPSNIVL